MWEENRKTRRKNSVGATLVTKYFTRTAPGLSSNLRTTNVWDNKNYFYPTFILSSFVCFCIDMPEDGLSTGRNM